MSARLDALATLAAAVMRGDAEALPRAARAAVATAGDAAARDLLRLMHLFVGFPRTIRAWNRIARELAPPAPAPAPPGAPAAEAAARARGEKRFRALYGEDAEPVLAHLRALDPRFAGWILEHAYGRAADGRVLALEEVERLSVLALAADACWEQCRSHLRACRRLDLPAAALRADAGRGGWLDAQARRALLGHLDEVYAGA